MSINKKKDALLLVMAFLFASGCGTDDPLTITKIATPKKHEATPPPPMDEPVMTSSDEITPSLMSALTAGAYQTECAGFVAYSIEDLATAANRYARENKMHAISASVVQEGKGSSACFRAMVVFHNPNSD
ncbi:hypothetical protein OAK45_08395 [Verrucomicrobia bacterium]|nr:hypothetical protein [Verrucomicrobiota bacterium]